MSETIETVAKLDAAQRGQETMLLALSPDELAGAHGNMREWAATMAKLMGDQADELQEAMNVAARSGWEFGTIERHKKLARKRRDFYAKIIAALDAGFMVVPNFEMTTWVVRTRRVNPSGGLRENAYSVPDWFPQESGRLPAGEGRYVGRSATYKHDVVERQNAKGEKTKLNRSWPDGFDESPAFPIAFAAPHVMERTSEALAALIFDEVGVSGDAATGDPILLGRVLNPRRGRQAVSFFIAWSMDLRRL